MLTQPDLSTELVALQRTATGRFEATFAADVPGTYLVSVPYQYGTDAEQRTGVLRTGVVTSYAAEYRDLQHNEGLLEEVARQTSGRVLSLSNADAVFEPWSIRPIHTRRWLWDNLVRVALGLFLLDVAARRVAVTPAEVAGRVRRFIGELAGRPAAATQAATLATLRGAKRRTQEERERPAAQPDVERAVPTNPPRQTPGDTRTAAAAAPPAVSEHATPNEGDYGRRLLRAKRRARRATDDYASSP